MSAILTPRSVVVHVASSTSDVTESKASSTQSERFSVAAVNVFTSTGSTLILQAAQMPAGSLDRTTQDTMRAAKYIRDSYANQTLEKQLEAQPSGDPVDVNAQSFINLHNIKLLTPASTPPTPLPINQKQNDVFEADGLAFFGAF